MTEHRITTTMQPGQVVVVSDEELQDLERMNVVASRLDGVPPAQKEDEGGEEEFEADGGQAPGSEEVGLRPPGRQ